MKKLLSLLLVLGMLALAAFSFVSCENIPGGDVIGGIVGGNTDGGDGGGGGQNDLSCEDGVHVDANDDNSCDLCFENVLVVVDFYALNDLHGKFCDNGDQPGVDELATYLNNRKEIDDNVILLSSGDMWQGSAESNLTDGVIITEWMNQMGFVSMTIGNHEYDWGEEMIRKNLEVADFPFLAINIYDISTGKRVDYCEPSVMVECDGIQIGIIGAIGDCYSSISSDMVQNVEFKVGSELITMVKNEANSLRDQGADIIVYSVHYGSSNLPKGVADIIFEGHSHQAYVDTDYNGITHIQGGGENQGISHAELSINSANKNIKVREAEVIYSREYSSLEDDPATEALEDKYSDVIEKAYEILGTSSKTLSSGTLADVVSELYLKAGLEKWGDDYDIVLGGGFIKPRSPYDISAGVITYADVLPIFPFNNQLTLCSVSGSKLLSQFLETTNSSYHVTCSEYGNSIRNNIDPYGTYYVIVDTYTAYYKWNGLTIVDFYDEGVYARDLLADEIRSGRFYVNHDNYTLTSIKDALEMGSHLNAGEQTLESFYVKGTIKEVVQDYYGNMYISDEEGNSIYVFGLNGIDGTAYGYMGNKPKVGDTVVVYGSILNYKGYTIEINGGTLIEIL